MPQIEAKVRQDRALLKVHFPPLSSPFSSLIIRNTVANAEDARPSVPTAVSSPAKAPGPSARSCLAPFSCQRARPLRFVLADTEKLHQKIAHMSDRIRQLEDAVAILQSTLSNEPHPLLTRELLTIKSSIELHAAVGQDTFSGQGSSKTGQRSEDESESAIDAFGTLAIRDDGAATFYGRSAGSEVCVSMWFLCFSP